MIYNRINYLIECNTCDMFRLKILIQKGRDVVPETRVWLPARVRSALCFLWPVPAGSSRSRESHVLLSSKNTGRC